MTIAIRKPAMGSAATAFLAKKQQMLIDGKWVDARSGKTFAVEDPATEEVIAMSRPATRPTSISRSPLPAAPSRPARGRASRRPPASAWSGRSATCWSGTPMNSPSWRRSTTANR
jgi:hypothetical protein